MRSEKRLPPRQLARWLNAKDLFDQAKASPGKVTEAVAASPVFRSAYADTLTRLKDWNGLQDWTTGRDWGPDDYLRVAYQLRAKRELNNLTGTEFQLGWNQADRRSMELIGADYTSPEVAQERAKGWFSEIITLKLKEILAFKGS